MCPPVRSKKMAVLARSPGQTAATGHLLSKMVRIGPMARAIFRLNRRELMAGLGAAALVRVMARQARAQGARPGGTASQSRRARAASRGAGDADLVARRAGPAIQARRNPRSQLRQRPAESRCPQLARNRRGRERRTADGPPAARGRGQGNPSNFHCDTPVPSCVTSLARRRPGPAVPGRAWSSRESEPVTVDRDEVFLIEDWRLRPDGTAIAPGRPQGRCNRSSRPTAGFRSISQCEPMNG